MQMPDHISSDLPSVQFSQDGSAIWRGSEPPATFLMFVRVCARTRVCAVRAEAHGTTLSPYSSRQGLFRQTQSLLK